MPRSITHGDVFLAYFNKIWGIPLRLVVQDKCQTATTLRRTGGRWIRIH
jgi:hypothetical protein